VIGRDTEGITVANALDYVIGWTIANDVTNVDRNPIDEKTFQGKGGIGYTPLGQWVETELDDPDDVPITVTINGETRAVSGTTYLPSTIAESIVYVADWVPLGAGDVVMTGAPNTAVPVNPTDIVEITIDGIGSLASEVV
jgi:2-keto-4-pentenoate hydratase/2-oxohepta-3-ene-1,7-dioic acid hydratase in catechol pathway